MVLSACGTVYEAVECGGKLVGPDSVSIRIAFLGGGSLSLVVTEVVSGCMTEVSRGAEFVEFAVSV